MPSQRDVRNRIASVQNIRTITRAMEMVAAARLRRAEQRIESLRPYADAIRRMTRDAATAAGQVPNMPILTEHESVQKVGLLLVAGDRGLAGAFNSQIVRAGVAASREDEAEGRQALFFASGRRPASSLTFRGLEPVAAFTGFSDRPSFADARQIANRLIAAYVDGDVDRVDIFYNGYVSAISQVVRRETLLPLQQASILEQDDSDAHDEASSSGEEPKQQALVEYEPDPEEILGRLVPDYVEISIFRALLESTASEHGARMTAMRNASENAAVLIDDLTLEMNRARQAAITQEILEVVAGAQGVS
ncbi:MAG TPA: ATP synthase F1 subunit gamma [Solirubrobacteraceae bacterium]|jgi:F-type H+-transporting ATPase subunit gamma|nr:ATP synthase F1 subunit gamma [Solirubrobacteraceae bacterium]